ncbi:MAG: hypothetical protein AAB113_10800 [Candidatus Eisenbacteria bacterium]
MTGTRTMTIRLAPRAGALVLGALLAVARPPSARAAEVFLAADCLEPPDGLLIGTGTQSYPAGVVISDPLFSNLAPCTALPAAIGGGADEYYDGQVDCEMSSDGRVNAQPAHAPVTFQLHIRYAEPTGPDTRRFDTEMLQLDISGGTLPFTMGFRESPPLASTGVTAIRAVPGGFMIDSFFDVFTELSLDGYTWYPAGLAAHLTLSSENVTEARTSTWGAIKTLYR